MTEVYEGKKTMSGCCSSRATVLVVDDEPSNLEVLCIQLMENNFRVLVAQDGQNAIRQAGETQPDIILLDVMMPGMDGFTTCRHLKVQESTRDIPVLFMTVASEAGDKVEGFEAGAVDYITKPFQVAEVVARLNVHCRIVRLQRSLQQKNERLQQEIARREQVEEQLYTTYDYLAGVMDNTPNLVQVMDAEGRYIIVNRATAALLGLPKEEITGKQFAELLPPDQAELFMERLGRVFETRRPLQVEDKLLIGDKLHYFSTVLFPLVDLHDHVYSVGGIAIDVTDRKQAELEMHQANAELRRHVKVLSTLNQVAQTMTTTPNLSAALNIVTRLVTRLLGVRSTSISLLNAHQTEITILALFSEVKSGPDLTGWSLSVEEIPGLGRLIEKKQVAVIERPQFEALLGGHLAEILLKETIQGLMVVPLLVRGAVIGVIVFSCDKVERCFSEQDINLAETIAAQVAGAIENVRLFEQVRQDAITKTALLEEVNHRVSNNLMSISGLLLAEKRFAPAEARPFVEVAMERVDQRIQGLIQVHTILTRSQWTPVSLEKLAERVVRVGLEAVCVSSWEARVEVDSSPVKVSPRQASSLALVLNELTTNTLKHGHSPVTVQIKLGLDGDTICLEYRDKGPGYPAAILGTVNGADRSAVEREGESGVGLFLLRQLVTRTLRGRLSLSNDEEGAVTRLEFPVEQVSTT